MPEGDNAVYDDQSGALTLWDAVSLVVGIVVGTAIFRSSPARVSKHDRPLARRSAPGPSAAGSRSLGALCYAELATTYPQSGGDYDYLTRAFGPWAGFLFGWAQLTAVFAANLGAMAYAFGDYGVELLGLDHAAVVWLAVAAIVGMSMSTRGRSRAGTLDAERAHRRQGARPRRRHPRRHKNRRAPGRPRPRRSDGVASEVAASATTPAAAEAAPAHAPSFGLAMVFVLYAYGGWNDAAFVAAEVRNRRRNMPLALVGGVAAITLHLPRRQRRLPHGLGFDGRRGNAHASGRRRSRGPLGRSGATLRQRPGDDLRPRRHQRHDPVALAHVRRAGRRPPRPRLARRLAAQATAPRAPHSPHRRQSRSRWSWPSAPHAGQRPIDALLTAARMPPRALARIRRRLRDARRRHRARVLGAVSRHGRGDDGPPHARARPRAALHRRRSTRSRRWCSAPRACTCSTAASTTPAGWPSPARRRSPSASCCTPPRAGVRLHSDRLRTTAVAQLRAQPLLNPEPFSRTAPCTSSNDFTSRAAISSAASPSAPPRSPPRSLADSAHVCTPAQTEGPFYPDHLPLDTDNDL